MAKLKDWLKRSEYSLLTGTAEEDVQDVIFDSRKAAPGTVFVCMAGSHTDSHVFLADAAAAGCRSFVVEKPLEELKLPEGTELNIIRVEDGRKALAELCCARFDYPAEKLKMIGITGTKGKTTVSYMLRSILSLAGHRTGVIGTNGCVINGKLYHTLNTTPGPYEINSLLDTMVREGCSAAVMECSSQGFKMHRTHGIRFDYGLFLNISPDHIGPDEHADFDEYLYCKSRLLPDSEVAVVNADDPHTEELLQLAGKRTGPCYSFSMHGKGDLNAGEPELVSDGSFTGTVFQLDGLASGEIRQDLPGSYNVMNALAAITVSLLMGAPLRCIQEAMSSIHVDGRMEVVERNDRYTVLVDYAHNALSMRSLLDTLREYDPARLVVVFGCGGNRSKDRRTGMGAAAAEKADFSIFTADNSRFEKTEDIIRDIEEAYLEAGGHQDHYAIVPDRYQAIRRAMANAQKGDMIAVIGKGHEDYQEENGVRHHFLDREAIEEIRKELQ